MARLGTARRGTVGRVGATLVAVLALTALTAAGASAATPIDLGFGSPPGPGLAITPSGAAALTYASGSTLNYCRVDPGAGSCSASQALSTGLPEFTVDTGNMPLVEGGTVRVVASSADSSSNEDKFLWSGESFSPATILGTNATPDSFLDFGEAVLAPAGTVNLTLPVIVAVGTGPVIAPTLNASGLTAGSGPGSTFHITNDSVSDTTVSVQGSMLSSAYIDRSNGNAVEWRRYTDSTGTPASIQTEAKWSTPLKIGEAREAENEVRMATGPNGLYVAYIRPGDGAVAIQHFNGTGFEAPVAISPGGAIEFAIYEDSGGLLHLAYRDPGGAHYRYAKDASNTTFSNPQTLPESAYGGMRIVTNAAGNGWLSWLDANSGHDFVLPLAPGEPTPPGPPGGSPAPTGTSATRTTTKSLGHGLVGTLTVPKDCVPGGQVFTAKVAVKKKGSKAHKVSYTVKKVVFKLGKKTILTDTRKPFEVSVPTKGVAAGATLTVGAKISVNLHVGPKKHTKVTKNLTASVKTC